MAMDKKSFLDNVIEQVRNVVPITTVVESKVSLIRSGGYYKGLCPFHNDRHIGSFVVSDKKQIFKCFSCGTGGDNIKFLALCEGINYVESAMKIALNNGIISQSENDEFFAKGYSNKKAEQIERIYLEKDKDKFKIVIAPNEVLNKVFKAFIKENPLSPEHKKYLLEKRGLSEEGIVKGGYFTFQSKRNSKLIMKEFLNTLREDYDYNQSILKDVPGFFREKATDTYTFAKNNGIGIPINNADGLCVGIQIRKDEAQQGKSRYTWFSSSYIELYENLSEKFDCSTASGSPIDVVLPEGKPIIKIFITEGRFKAQLIAETFGAVAISVQGVGNWRNISEQVKVVLKRFPKSNIQFIYVAFDADMSYNTQVFDQAMKMTNNLKRELQEQLQIRYVMWSVDYGKGIDDLVLAGHEKMIVATDKESFDIIYSEFIEGVKKKYPDIDMNKVPKEFLKEYYEIVVVNEHFKSFGEYDEVYKNKITKNAS